MLKIGLTGSIGMGKSTTSEMFKQQGVPIFDADDMVHTLYKQGYQGYDMVASICPEATQGDAVDRKILSAFVQENPHALTAIEQKLHPLIRKIEVEFYNQMPVQNLVHGAFIVVAGLLLLTPGFFTDFIGFSLFIPQVRLMAAAFIGRRFKQSQAFGNKTSAGFEFHSTTYTKQIPDTEKRERADYIVDTSDGFDVAQLQVNEIIKILDQLSENQT